MKNQDQNVRWITQGAVIAAAYVALTVVFAPISFGPVQLRIAEALCIMPLFTPAAVPGLFIGCLLANIIGGGIAVDVVFGSIATLIGAWLGCKLRHNRCFVPIPAILANTIIVPFVLYYGYGFTDTVIPLLALQIFIGEVGGCFVLGELLATALLKRNIALFSDVTDA